MIQYKKTFASFLFILISFVCSAQTPPPPQPPTGPPGLPIDGNLYVLIIAAVLYGIYKAYKLKRNSI